MHSAVITAESMEQLRSCVPAAVVAEIDSALKSSDPAAACAALSSFFLGPGRAELAQVRLNQPRLSCIRAWEKEISTS